MLFIEYRGIPTSSVRRTGEDYTSPKNRYRPHQSREQRASVKPKGKLVTRRPAPKLDRDSLVEQRSHQPTKNQSHKGQKTKEETSTKEQSTHPMKTTPENSTNTYDRPKPRHLNASAIIKLTTVREIWHHHILWQQDPNIPTKLKHKEITLKTISLRW